MIFGKTGPELDSVDLEIVRALQQDAKTPLSKLGERVGLSPPAAMERVRKLEQARIITGYAALVDARSAGLDVAAFIGVSCSCPEDLAEFERWAGEEPRVLECHHVTGPYALLVKIKARDTRALEELISRIRSLQGVQRTETMVVLSTNIERVDLPLDDLVDSDEEPRAGRGRRRSSNEVAGEATG